MFCGIRSNPLRVTLFAMATLVLAFAIFLSGAKAEIEEAVVECRKTCVEQQCVPEYQACMTKALGSPQSCRTIRQDCEKTCVSERCLP